jgi:hypothetical protein
VEARQAPLETDVDQELKCGAYEGHCCQRSDEDAYSVGGVALVVIELESVPDEWVQWLEEL